MIDYFKFDVMLMNDDVITSVDLHITGAINHMLSTTLEVLTSSFHLIQRVLLQKMNWKSG